MAARRLLPASVRPRAPEMSVAALAAYLRENLYVDRQALISSAYPAFASRHVGNPIQDASPAIATSPVIESTASMSGDATHPDLDLTSMFRPSLQYGADSVGLEDVGMLLSAAVASLPNERDRDVLGLRLGLDGQPRTFAVIGAEWGVTRERVRQVQERALRRMAYRSRYEGMPGAALRALLEPASGSAESLASLLLEICHSSFDIPPNLAAKLVLRAAGFSAASALEIASILPALVRAKRAQLRNEHLHRSSAQRVGQIFGRWLEHCDWPEQLAPPPAVERLSSQRAVNGSEIAGLFHSAKLGRPVQYESGLELTVLKLLERCEQVAYYQEQPAVIPYTFAGRDRSYFPDLFIATTDGRGLLLEVKPSDGMALSINQAKARAGRTWANSQGWGWLVVSDRHTIKEIEEHVIPLHRWHALEQELKLRGVLTWHDMISLRTNHGLTRLDVTAYVVQSGAVLDSGYRLTAGTN
ncbi:hypothetical protein M2299_002716 [Stenotrophomonas sp. 1278]|nr:hypothetical protein [Stenotrophomonas sp. 1278]